MATETKPGLDILYKIAGDKHYRLQMAGIKNIEKNELIDEGYLGFVEALSSYDPAKSANLESYIAAKIKFAIWRYLRRLDIIDYRQRAKLKILKRCRESFYAQHGRYPGIHDLAKILNKTLGEINKLVNIMAIDEGIKNAQEFEEYMLYREDVENIDAHFLFEDTRNCIEAFGDDTPIQVLALLKLKELKVKDIVKIIGVGYSATKITRFIKQGRKILIKCLTEKGWTVLDIEETLE